MLLGRLVGRPAQPLDQPLVRRRKRFPQLPDPRHMRCLCSVHDGLLPPEGGSHKLSEDDGSHQHFRSSGSRTTDPDDYLAPPKNDARGISRIVCSPGATSRIFGSELTTIAAVAMSPC